MEFRLSSRTPFFVIAGERGWISTGVDPGKTLLVWDKSVGEGGLTNGLRSVGVTDRSNKSSAFSLWFLSRGWAPLPR